MLAAPFRMTSATSSLLARLNPRATSTPAIAPADRCVLKRDGTSVPWDASKITRAVALAYYEVTHDAAPNPNRDDLAACFGLDADSFHKVQLITSRVARML